MKGLVCVLLLMLVCCHTAHSLRCYTCVGDNCKVRTDCPPSAIFCRTKVNATYLSRTCEETCTSETNVYCCDQDFCG